MTDPNKQQLQWAAKGKQDGDEGEEAQGRDCSVRLRKWYNGGRTPQQANNINASKKTEPQPFHAVLIGDSTMFRLGNMVRNLLTKRWGGGSVLKRSSGKCGIEKYLGISDNCSHNDRRQNSATCMTNTHEVLRTPTCYGCSGCDSQLWISAKPTSKETSPTTLEYIALMSSDTVTPLPMLANYSTSTKEAGVGIGRNIGYARTPDASLLLAAAAAAAAAAAGCC